MNVQRSGSQLMRVWGAMLAAMAVAAAEAQDKPADNPLAPLARLSGAWVTGGTWDDPSKGSIRVTYAWQCNQRVMTGESYVNDAGGRNHVYHTVFAWHPGCKRIVFMSFSAWGAVYEGWVTPQGDNLELEWDDDTGETVTRWRETITFSGDDTFSWRVWKKVGENWEQAKESSLRRESPTATITQGAAARTSGRRIELEAVVPAGVSLVWEAWTTTAGARTFFAPGANIELRLGGPFEIYFMPTAPEGSRGSDGCNVLAYVPNEMLSFTWNAPPKFPEIRRQRSFVVLRFEPLSDTSTRVRLVHEGFGEGDAWGQVHEYFLQAWPTVLKRLAQRFESGPIDWSARG
jgi:uncharacterized protein YndB with AHSA1/START domain